MGKLLSVRFVREVYTLGHQEPPRIGTQGGVGRTNKPPSYSLRTTSESSKRVLSGRAFYHTPFMRQNSALRQNFSVVEKGRSRRRQTSLTLSLLT